MKSNKSVIYKKIGESLGSVLPIVAIVAAICLFVVPIDNGLVLAFIIGSVLLVVGMGLFQLGADTAMIEIGNHLGAKITKTKNLLLITVLSFVLGVAITMAEPDLQVLATNVPSVDTELLVLVVSAGVGFFLMVAMLRIILNVPIKYLLVGSYALVFILAAFCPKDFLSIAFDSGGVTTGPMTVPFIMSLGAGVASIRSDENAKSDGFGLVGLCSIGPILAVLILGMVFPSESAESGTMILEFVNSVSIGRGYIRSMPTYMAEVALALLPIFVFFAIFQVVSLKLKKQSFLGILMGLAYTYFGLVLFLTGANVGFSSLGYELGGKMAESSVNYLMVPLAMIFGWFIINAEPAVHVLNKQVEEMSAGAISAKAMGLSLSLAISVANGLAMIRVLSGVSLWYFIIPGYAISLILAFFVPQTFTAIAFDSGGVASGPMTATFMLPFAMGACNALGGNILTDAFGLVSLVAMMPLITVQIMGAISAVSSKKRVVAITKPVYSQDAIIELWEAV